MRFEKWIPASLFVLVVGVAAGACSSSSSGAPDDACATICGDMRDCNGSSCLAYCIGIEVACSTAKKTSPTAFSDWAACGPKLACVVGEGFSEPASDCPLAQIELISCGTTSVSTVDPDSGIHPTHDAGTDSPVVIVFKDAGHDRGVSDDDAGYDAGEDVIETFDASCGECESNCFNACDEECTGGECETTCQPDGTCNADCEDNCGNSCSGGSCVCESNGECLSTCVDNCGNTCTGDECVCTPDGTCNADCEDNCGNTCTGGSCVSSCTSTGCTNCAADCDDGITCDDNCGNDCCSE